MRLLPVLLLAACSPAAPSLDADSDAAGAAPDLAPVADAAEVLDLAAPDDARPKPDMAKPCALAQRHGPWLVEIDPATWQGSLDFLDGAAPAPLVWVLTGSMSPADAAAHWCSGTADIGLCTGPYPDAGYEGCMGRPAPEFRLWAPPPANLVAFAHCDDPRCLP